MTQLMPGVMQAIADGRNRGVPFDPLGGEFQDPARLSNIALYVVQYDPSTRVSSSLAYVVYVESP